MAKQSYLYQNKNHVANINIVRLSGNFCDVTIKVNDKEYRAHKIILAANLKYFESKLLSSFKSSKQDIIILHDVDETYLQSFISYAYTGEILLTDANVLGLFKLAVYLNEDSIKESCIEFLNTHLKKEDACRIFGFATSIGCLSLKNVAKQVILSNFGDCSMTKEFLAFDFESLIHILSDESLHFIGPGELFFDGLIKWISHDAKNRKTHINDLLEFIEITKLSSDYLLQWVCKTIKGQCDILKTVMSFYNEKIQKMDYTGDLKQKFMIIVGTTNSKLHVQYFDHTSKKWGNLHEIINNSEQYIGPGIILNNTFFYTTRASYEMHLHALYPSTEKNTKLLIESRLASFSAICACTRYLYFCGGLRNNYEINEVLRYDPLTNNLETLPPMRNIRYNAAAIFYQGCLYVLGGYRETEYLYSVEKYDLQSKEWTDLPSMSEGRYSPAVAFLDGKLYACGGENKSNVEVYDLSKNSWQPVARMNKVRCRFLVIAHEGKLLAIGGDADKTIEVYDPKKDKWETDIELSSGLKIEYPQGRLISFNCVK